MAESITFIEKYMRSEWCKRNSYLIFISLLFFLSNQLLELLIVKIFGYGYSSLCGWDCGWYSGIVEHGYDIEPHEHLKGDAANWAFFPILPLIGKFIYYATSYSPGTSLVISAKFFFLLSIFMFIKFGIAYNDDFNPILLGGVATFSPYSLYGNVGYTEPVFLFFTCVFFYCLKKNSFLLASIIGALLSAVKLVGIVALVSYLATGFKVFLFLKDNHKKEKMFLGILIIPLGLSLFMVYLYLLTGDALAFINIQRAWGRTPENPVKIVLSGFGNGMLNQYWAIMSVFAVLISLYYAFKKDFDLALFSFFCTVIPLSTGLLCMPRYIWWQAPILLFVATIISIKKTWIIYFPLSVSGLVWMYFSWIHGKWFVV